MRLGLMKTILQWEAKGNLDEKKMSHTTSNKSLSVT